MGICFFNNGFTSGPILPFDHGQCPKEGATFPASGARPQRKQHVPTVHVVPFLDPLSNFSRFLFFTFTQVFSLLADLFFIFSPNSMIFLSPPVHVFIEAD